jgi:hypothetical protein
VGEDDDGVVGFQAVSGGGVLEEGAVGLLDAEDHAAGFDAFEELLEGFAVVDAVGRDGVLDDFDAEFLEIAFDVAGAVLEDAVHGGVGDAVGDLHAADEGGKDDFVGPGLLELFLVGGVLGAGDDAEVGSHVAGGEGDEDVDHVVGQDGGEDDGALDVGFGEGVFIAGIADEGLEAMAVGEGDAVGVVVDDEEGEVLGNEFAAQGLADAAIAADDGVVRDGFDVP